MKKVSLISLTMRNFRGEKERTTVFNPEGETTISGDNGLGKTRHFDAFMWLLFGKDKYDRKDYNVRTLINNEPLHRVECSVEAMLDIDGMTLKLKRSFVEKWVKQRGQTEEVFRGNETETTWNDVPVGVTEYQKRINEIINDSIFKMVTNPMYFAGMKWQDQREQLFQLAGTITDTEIGAKNPEFAALLDRITGKSFAEFKREISARKKRLKEELDTVQPRIDQTHKLMPESTDFEELEAEIKKYEQQIADIDKAIANKAEASEQQYKEIQAKQREINDLKQKQQKVLFDAQTKAREDNFKANEKRGEIENNIKSLQSKINSNKADIQNYETKKKNLQNQIIAKEDEITKKRKEWHGENAKEYAGSDICGTCGQELPENLKVNARKLFADTKSKKLAEINSRGKDLNAEIDVLSKQIDDIDKFLESRTKEVDEFEKSIIDLQNQLAAMPVIEKKDVVANDLPEYVELTTKTQAIEAELSKMQLGDPSDTAELRAKKITVFNEIRTREARLRDRETIARYTKEIADLEATGKKLAQQIADVECEEYTIQQFTKAKIEECERRINCLFNHVTFKLFDYTIDGNEYETCVPLINGVPFDVANTAGQVNAGLDIINALVQFHGISAPIFIDNSESVNNIIPVKSQVIHLVVTKDKELIIK